jgi:hypothetical protein
MELNLKKRAKRINTFWSLLALAIIAAIAAAVVLWVAQENIRQEDINSLSYSIFYN